MAQMKYYYELTISSSPHVHSPVTTKTLMRDVLIGLLPALIGSVYFFGFRALTVTAVSALACFIFEKLWCKLMKQDDKTYDMSALVTGVLLAFVCPPTIPYWMIVMGDLFGVAGMIIGVPLFVVLTSAFEGLLSIGLKRRGLSDEAALYVDMSHMDMETGLPVPKNQSQMTVGKKAPNHESTESGE